MFYLNNTQLNTLGTLLSGIGTIAATLIGGAIANRWHTERRLEKMSDIAEATLVNLNIFKDRIEDWQKYVYCTFDNTSERNKEGFNKLSEEGKKLEWRNYAKEAYKILQKLYEVKYSIQILNSPKADDAVSKLEQQVKDMTMSLQGLYFESLNNDLKIGAHECFSSAPHSIETYYSIIHKELREFLLFRKRGRSWLFATLSIAILILTAYCICCLLKIPE